MMVVHLDDYLVDPLVEKMDDSRVDEKAAL